MVKKRFGIFVIIILVLIITGYFWWPVLFPPSADLSIAKTGPAAVEAGAAVSYLVNVNNAGSDSADSVEMKDTLPAGLSAVMFAGSGWSCSLASGVLACTRPSASVGAQPSITINGKAPLSAATLTNSVSVQAVTADPNVSNNNASFTTTVTAPPPPPGCGGPKCFAVKLNCQPSYEHPCLVFRVRATNGSKANLCATGLAAQRGLTCSSLGPPVECPSATAPCTGCVGGCPVDCNSSGSYCIGSVITCPPGNPTTPCPL